MYILCVTGLKLLYIRLFLDNVCFFLVKTGWQPVQVRYQQPEMAKNVPYSWRHKKPETQNQKKFLFMADWKSYGVFWGFEQFSSVIG